VIIFTKHALEKMDGYGVEMRDVKQVIKTGMKWKEERSDKWHASMMGIEAVFTKQDGRLIVITVYRSGRST